jgi:hypothetical protein
MSAAVWAIVDENPFNPFLVQALTPQWDHEVNDWTMRGCMTVLHSGADVPGTVTWGTVIWAVSSAPVVNSVQRQLMKVRTA